MTADLDASRARLRAATSLIQWLVLALALLWLAYFLARAPGWWAVTASDFNGVWDGLREMAGAGDLYSGKRRGLDPFYAYPPAFAAALAWLTRLDIGAVFGLWAGAHALALAACLVLACELAGLREPARVRAYLALVAFALIGTLLEDFVLAQVNLFWLAFTLGGLVALKHRRPALAGLLLASAVHVKVLPIAIMGGLLARRQWGAALNFGLAVLVLCGLPLLWTVPQLGFGGGIERCLEWHLEFAREVPLAGAFGEYLDTQYRWANISLPALLHRLFDNEAIVDVGSPAPGALLFGLAPAHVDALARLLALALLVLCWRAAARTRHAPALEPASLLLWLVAFQFAGLLCWPHHAVSLIACLALLCACQERLARGLAVVLCAGFSLPYWPAPLSTGWAHEAVRFVNLHGVSSFGLAATVASLLYLLRGPGHTAQAQAPISSSPES